MNFLKKAPWRRKQKALIDKLIPELHSVISSLSDLIYPPKCISCSSKPVSATIPFCYPCLCKISPIGSSFTKLSTLKKSTVDLGKAICLGFHEGPLQKAILAVKQNNDINLGKFLGYTLANIIPESFIEADLIAYVPSSKESMRKRGFNPSKVLANQLSITSGIPVIKGLITKTRRTDKQALLSYSQRIKNVAGAYRTTQNVKNTKIILVDDVLTTGSTVIACGNQLIRAGGKIIGTAFYSYRPLFCT